MTAMMLAVSPRESVHTSRCGRCGSLDAAAVGLFDGVFLDEHPLDSRSQPGCGRTRRRHRDGWAAPSRRGESPDAPERLQAEDGGEVVLPGAHVQPIILDGRGRRHRVAPGAAEPLDGLAGPAVAGEVPERVEYVVQAHLPQAVQQGARVVEHHPGLAAFIEQLRNELAHALVAPVNTGALWLSPMSGCSIIHSRLLMIRRGAQVAAGRDQRLVHVQRDRERAGGAL